MQPHIFTSQAPFPLESGESLPQIEIAYSTYGNYLPNQTKVVWVCHALTANSNVFEWWQGLFGEKDFFNPNEYFIICANILGSCYGSTHALSLNPETNLPYYHAFPFLTIRDLVNAHILLRKHLKIEKIDILVGGSLGGQQALEWSIIENQVIQNQILIATNAVHSPWGIAFNESQRMCIEADKSWKESHPQAGMEGMKAARAVALLSYRNEETYSHFQQENTDKTKGFRASTYQKYQGEKLANRFNAFSYVTLSRAMDSHNIARGRGASVPEILRSIRIPTFIIGISSDLLFPLKEQVLMARNIPQSEIAIIDSIYGHDGFLIETEQISKAIRKFILHANRVYKESFSIH
jgi:homoserine O-acetyltransferase